MRWNTCTECRHFLIETKFEIGSVKQNAKKIYRSYKIVLL